MVGEALGELVQDQLGLRDHGSSTALKTGKVIVIRYSRGLQHDDYPHNRSNRRGELQKLKRDLGIQIEEELGQPAQLIDQSVEKSKTNRVARIGESDTTC